jgi:protein O-mannosyl-transferase
MTNQRYSDQPARRLPRTAGSPAPNTRRIAGGCAVLVCLTLVAYVPALRAGFVFDDDTYLTANPVVQSPSGLAEIWLNPSASPQYYPLTFTSFWIEHHFWKLNPLGYHLVNILLHAANAVLLYLLLRRLEIPGAWLAAAVFAVHPIQVESVAWIVERKNVLSGFFYLAATHAYLRFAGVCGNGRSGRWTLYALAMLFLVCSLSAKSVSVTWPAAMLLLLWWRKTRLTVRDLLPLIPAFMVAAGSGLLTSWVERQQVGARGPEFAWTFAESWIIAGRAVWFYTGKLLWPSSLCFVYPRWSVETHTLLQAAYPAAVVAVLICLRLLRPVMGKGPLVAALFFVGTLGPALGFVKIYAMRYSFVADHWAYHASPGLIVPVVAALALLAAHVNRRRSLFRYAAAVAVTVLMLLTGLQSRHYRDIEVFWRAVLATNPNAWMAHNNLGQHLMRRGHYVEALEHFSDAVRLKPGNYVALTNRGAAMFKESRVEDAIKEYRAALAINPDYPLARNDLGIALLESGRLDDAIRELQRAVELRPGYSPARQHLAMALEQKGDWAGAIAQYKAALSGQPDSEVICNNLAWLLATVPDDTLRDGREAVRLSQQACELTHAGVAEMLGTLSAAYAESGRFPEAIETARRARQVAVLAGREDVGGRMDEMAHLYAGGKPVRLVRRVATQPSSSPAGEGL